MDKCGAHQRHSGQLATDVETGTEVVSSMPTTTSLTILILTGLWFIREQPEWARPFELTPVPTKAAISYINEGDIHFAEGQLHQAIAAYEQAIFLEPDNDVPYNKQAKVSFVTDINSIEKGYLVIIENAKYGNYSVRAFDESKKCCVIVPYPMPMHHI